MPPESKKIGANAPSDEAKFGDEVQTSVEEPTVKESDITPDEGAGVSVSLRHYNSSCECFSKWQSNDLKKFSSTLLKIRRYTFDKLRVNKSLCEIHKGEPKKSKFSRPSAVSEDVPFYEIKVDPSNKCRIHGFFSDNIFYLVWLDRGHECFPS